MTRSILATFAAATLAALALPGCEAQRPDRIDADAIEPASTWAPSQLPPDSVPLVEGAGFLRVETDPREVRPGYASGEGDSLAYSVCDSYDVYDDAGKFVKHVVNYTKVTDPAPATTQLAAGRYLVAIPDSRWPRSWLAVTVEAGRLTKADVRTPARASPPASTPAR